MNELDKFCPPPRLTVTSRQVERDLTVPTSEIFIHRIKKEIRNAICYGRKRKFRRHRALL